MLEILYNDTAAAIPNPNFYPERAVVVTWYRMYFERFDFKECAGNENCVSRFQLGRSQLENKTN